jgi:hypothetical protein
MLEGVDWASVRPVIELALGYRFGSRTGQPLKWGDTRGGTRDVAVTLLLDYLGLPEIYREGASTSGYAPRGRIPRYKIPEGRGMIVLRLARFCIGHVVAYENGRVYDPASTESVGTVEGDDSPMTLACFETIYRASGWRIDRVIGLDNVEL